jgi:hypothetical protein
MRNKHYYAIKIARRLLSVPKWVSSILNYAMFFASLEAFWYWSEANLTEVTVLGILIVLAAVKVASWVSNSFAALAERVMIRERLRQMFGARFSSWEDLAAWIEDASLEQIEDAIKCRDSEIAEEEPVTN